ncbi:hypothetical protein KAJ87_04000 [Candidatus Pacearchaeota archaeon]|nr:hypothetical protein [Candidatus Pacearchaeota archaeon]
MKRTNYFDLNKNPLKEGLYADSFFGELCYVSKKKGRWTGEYDSGEIVVLRSEEFALSRRSGDLYPISLDKQLVDLEREVQFLKGLKTQFPNLE